MKSVLITTIMFLVMACGYADPNADTSQTDKNKTDGSTTSTDTSGDPAAMAGDNGTTVTVTVNVNTDTGSQKQDKQLLYRPQLVNWEAAKKNSPRGFHLPSRSELVDLYDQGLLSEVADAQTYVWSSSKFVQGNEDIQVWCVHVDQGVTDTFYPDQQLWPTLYIGNVSKHTSGSSTIDNSVTNNNNGSSNTNINSNINND